MKISEIITDRYKLRIPPTVYYDLLADVREVEEEQEPQTFKWCTDCKEYDQEKHCCHRWSKVIRDTVEEIQTGSLSLTKNNLEDAQKAIYEISKNIKFIDPSVTPQEPTDKKFTKADINAIVKAINKGWELRVNEILDKIRVDIFKYEGDCRLSVDEYPSCEQCTASVFTTIYKILDKYKADIEPQESEET